MYTLFLRTAITYLILICAIRLMGKRQIGELELSELVITMLLSELASIPIADNTIPLTFSLIPITILVSLEGLVSFLSIKCRKFKKIVGGTPSILICRGAISKKEMEKARITLDELLCQLRLKNISDISDVEYAILEENGQISFIQKMSARNVTLSDLKISRQEKGIMHTVIADGQVSEFNLKLLGRSEKWLKKELKKRKCRMSDVFLMTVDDSGNVNLIKTEETI